MDNAVGFPKFRYFVGFVAAWAWLNIGWVIVGFAPLIPFIAAEYNVSVGTVMIAVMVTNAVAGGISIILCGPLIDRFGPRKVLFVSAILCVIYALLIPHFSQNIMELAFLRVLSGLFGHGALFAGKAAMAQRWFPKKEQGTWIGIWNALFAGGVAVMYLTYFPLLKYFDGEWRDLGAFSAVPSAILAILVGITLLVKEPEVSRHFAPPAIVKRDFSVALKVPALWAGAILLGCAQGIMQSVNGLTATFLLAAKPLGLDWLPFKAGPAMTFVQWGMIISGFLMGALLVYIFRGSIKWLASFNFLLAGLAAFLLATSFSRASLFHMEISFVLVGFFMNLGYPAVTTFIAQNYPPPILGKVFGVSGGISIFMGAIFSGLSGKIVDWTQSFTAMYAFIMAIGIFACIVAAIFLNPVKVFAKKEAPSELASAGAKH
jgi:MFS family permease